MQVPPRNRVFRLSPVNITLIYLVIGFLWILFSDRLLEQIATDAATLTTLQTFKGWFYVLITGLLLFMLINLYKSALVNTREGFIKKFRQYKALLEHANQIIIQVNKNGKFLYINPVIKKILGYDANNMRSLDDLESIVHQEDINRFQEIRKYWQHSSPESFNFPIQLRHNDGEWRWFKLIVSDERRLKNVESVLLILRDIHEETKLYDRIRQTKERFEHLFQDAPVGYHSFDSSLKIKDINRTELKIIGYERDEVIGKLSWSDLIVPEERPLFEEHIKNLFEKGKVENFSYTVVRKNREKRSVILNAKAFFDKEDKFLYSLGNIIDVTDKIEAEKHLSEAYRRLHYHIQNSPLGFVEMDNNFRILDWSDESERMFGWNKKKVQDKRLFDFDFVHPEDRDRITGELMKLLKGEQTNNVIQLRSLTEDGRVLVCEWYNSALKDNRDCVISIMSLAHDITDREKALEEIKKLNATLEERVKDRTKELETVNKELESFAYSVSHDLRAPLRGIDGFSQALLEQYTDVLDERGKRYLSRVRSGSQKMGVLIDDILSLSRITRLKFNREEVDLAAIAETIIGQLKEKNPGKKVKLEKPDRLLVFGDARLLNIMMQNLLENAWKFSSKRDVIRIEMGVDKTKKDSVIHIKDNGVGFNMKYHDNLFTAFQRLHSEEEFPGTGIGLATVQRIVHRHSGTIWAKSEEGKGAGFYFTLPSFDGSNVGEVGR